MEKMKQLKSTFLITLLLTLSVLSPHILAKPPTETTVMININKADASAFQLLKGIGKIRAKSIVMYRKKNGAFKSINDLALVKGISKKIIAKNIKNLSLKKGLITVPAKKARAKRKVEPIKNKVEKRKEQIKPSI